MIFTNQPYFDYVVVLNIHTAVSYKNTWLFPFYKFWAEPQVSGILLFSFTNF